MHYKNYPKKSKRKVFHLLCEEVKTSPPFIFISLGSLADVNTLTTSGLYLFSFLTIASLPYSFEKYGKFLLKINPALLPWIPLKKSCSSPVVAKGQWGHSTQLGLELWGGNSVETGNQTAAF